MRTLSFLEIPEKHHEIQFLPPSRSLCRVPLDVLQQPNTAHVILMGMFQGEFCLQRAPRTLPGVKERIISYTKIHRKDLFGLPGTRAVALAPLPFAAGTIYLLVVTHLLHVKHRRPLGSGEGKDALGLFFCWRAVEASYATEV